jgi:hypothetical protein
MLRLGLALCLPACLSEGTLSDFRQTAPDLQVHLTDTPGRADLYLHLHGKCDRVTSRLHATLDGEPLALQSDDCESVWLESQMLPPPSESSTLIITDDTTTWTIDVANLFAHDIVLTRPPKQYGSACAGTAVWEVSPGVDSAWIVTYDENHGITYNSLSDGFPRNVTLAGDTIEFAVPSVVFPATLSISATSTPMVTRCDGPASCDVMADASRHFAVDGCI